MSNLPNKYATSLSVKDTAKFLHVSSKTIRRWEEKGLLKSDRTLGGHRRFSVADILELRKKQAQNRRDHQIGLILEKQAKTKVQSNSFENFIRHTPLVLKSNEKIALPRFNFIKAEKALFLISLVTILLFAESKLNLFPQNGILGLNKLNTAGYAEIIQPTFKEVLAQTISLDDVLFDVGVDGFFGQNLEVAGEVTFSSLGEGIVQSSSEGVLSIAESIGGDLITTDSLDFSEISDELTLDADTTIEESGDADTLTFNSGTTLSVQGTFILGSDSFTDLTGTGLSVSGGVLSTTLGTAVSSSEISDDEILEIDLKVSNTAASGQILTYNSSTGGFTWVDTTGVGLWTDGGTFAYLTTTTDDLVLGGTTVATADIFFGDDGSAIFNEQGNDVDFRIEGDTDVNLFFVDASTNRIGVGTSVPLSLLHIGSAGTPGSIDGTDDLYVYDDLEVDGTIYGNFSGGVATTLSQGSVVFVDGSGNLVEDNANFFWNDTSNRLGIGTSTPATQFEINAAATTTGTVFNLAYKTNTTLTGDTIGAKFNLDDGTVDATNQSVTGLEVKLPTTTNTHTTGTKILKGFLVSFGTGAGINQNGAGGTTTYNALDVDLPALTQTAGTLNVNGLYIDTPSSITTGGTASGIYVNAAGVGAGSLYGVNITNITGSTGTERALNIGSGWDNVLVVNSVPIINGSGVTQVAGGGTSFSTYTQGDILYSDAANSLVKLGIGTTNQVLTISGGGVPAWGTISGSTCTNCLINNPTSDQIIAPTGQDTVGMEVRQTSTASPTDDIFAVTNSDGTTKYLYVDSAGVVNIPDIGSASGDQLTIEPGTDKFALKLLGTNVATNSLQLIDAYNTSGTIFDIDYIAATSLAGDLIGMDIDLDTNLTVTNQSVTGQKITLPDWTNTHTSGTKSYYGVVIAPPGGGGVNMNGAGGTSEYILVDLTMPALTQTAGTLNAYGIDLTTPSSITTGGTAYGINVNSTGVGAGTLYGMNISNITAGAGSERAINIGTGWDYGIYAANTEDNYFAGEVGIGTTSPSAKVDITTQINGTPSRGVAIADDNTSTTGSVYGLEVNFDDTDITDKYGVRNVLTNGSGIGNYTVMAMDGLSTISSPLSTVGYGNQTYISTKNDAVVQTNTAYLAQMTTYSGAADVAYGFRANSVDAFTSGGTQYGLYLNLTDTSATRWGVYEAGGATNYLAGNLGIGTTSPQSLLHVGASGIPGNIDGTNDVYILDDLEVDGTIFADGGITQGGNLTITKADPSIILDTLTATDTDFWLGVQEDAGGDDDDVFLIGDGTTPGTNPFLSILTSGNVGIGTTSPGTKLSIAGGVGIGTTDSFANAAIAANNLAVQGSVGIGTTSPTTPLDVRQTDAANATAVTIDTEESTSTQNVVNVISDYFGDERSAFTISAGGNVAIGTTAGNDKIRATLTMNGDEIIKGKKDIETIANITNVFVYDTTKDVDGGAWRNDDRAKASSWYNETIDATGAACDISTNDRCGRKEFPEKAIIITTGTASVDGSVYIFDAKDNTMWMKFTPSANNMLRSLAASWSSYSQVAAALNGEMYIGVNGNGHGFLAINFKTDSSTSSTGSVASDGRYKSNISARNSNSTFLADTAVPATDDHVNDLSVAKINGKTYIAVATDTGFFVVNETDMVSLQYCDTSASENYNAIWLTSKGQVYAVSETNTNLQRWDNVHTDTAAECAGTPDMLWSTSTTPALWTAAPTIQTNAPDQLVVKEGTSTVDGTSNTMYFAHAGGLSVINAKNGDETNGSAKYYTNTYITDEMIGDIRGMWALNATDTASDLEDLSVKTNNLTATNIDSNDAASGARGKATDFDGSTENLSIATASDADLDFNGSESFSISTWARVTTMPSTGEQDAIVAKWDASNSQRGYRLFIENDDADTSGNLQFDVYDESADQTITATMANDTINTGSWFHVVATFNGGATGAAGDAKLYFNGTLVNSSSANGSFLGLEDVTSDFTIADYDADDAVATDTAFTGRIDDVVVTAEVLTPAQIKHMYEVSYNAFRQHTASRVTGLTDADTYQQFAGGGTAGATVANTTAVTVDDSNQFIYVGTSDGSANTGGVSVIGIDSDSVVDLFDATNNTGKDDDSGTQFAGNDVVSISVAGNRCIGFNSGTTACGSSGVLAIAGTNDTSTSIWMDSSDYSLASSLYALTSPNLVKDNMTVNNIFRVFNTYNNYGDDNTGNPETTEAFIVDQFGNLTLRGQDAGTTGPVMTLHHNSASSAANDLVGLLNFAGQNSADEQINFGRISSSIIDTTDGSEDGTLIFNTMKAGTLTEAMRINESGYVGIGTTAPQSKLDVEGGVAIGATYSGTSVAPTNGLIVEGSVGIGVTAPTDTLHVVGQGYFESGVHIGADADNNLFDDASTGAGTTTMYIGNASINVTASDERLKKDIADSNINAMDIIEQLKVVDFNWKDNQEWAERGRWTGMLAQDVYDILPQVVNKPSDPNNTWSIEYHHMVPYLVKGMQEQQIEMDELGNVVMSSQELLTGLNDVQTSDHQMLDERLSLLEGEIKRLSDELLAINNNLQNSIEETDLMAVNNDLTADSLTTTDLVVAGSSTLADTTVTGVLSIGLMQVNPINNSINTVSVLKIQDMALGAVEFMNGLVQIDTKGNLVAQEVTANKYKVAGASAGTSTLLAGETEMFIETDQITENSMVFVTTKTVTSNQLSVIGKEVGLGFRVAVTQSENTDLLFDWFIIDKVDKSVVIN